MSRLGRASEIARLRSRRNSLARRPHRRNRGRMMKLILSAIGAALLLSLSASAPAQTEKDQEASSGTAATSPTPFSKTKIDANEAKTGGGSRGTMPNPGETAGKDAN